MYLIEKQSKNQWADKSDSPASAALTLFTKIKAAQRAPRLGCQVAARTPCGGRRLWVENTIFLPELIPRFILKLLQNKTEPARPLWTASGRLLTGDFTGKLGQIQNLHGSGFYVVLLVLMFGGPHMCSTPTARNNPFHIKSPAALLLLEEETRCVSS